MLLEGIREMSEQDVEGTHIERGLQIKQLKFALKSALEIIDRGSVKQPISAPGLTKVQLEGIVDEYEDKRNIKKSLPGKRGGYTQKSKIAGQTIYLRTGEYPDGSLGEIYCDLSKQGSFARSMVSAFCIAISVGLQHGVPLEVFVRHFVATKFEPGGLVVNHNRISMATSILDLIFKDLAIHYLGREELSNKGSIKVAGHPVEEVKDVLITENKEGFDSLEGG